MNQSRIVTKAILIASNIKEEKDQSKLIRLSSALSLLAIASSIEDDSNKNRLIQLADKMIVGGTSG